MGSHACRHALGGVVVCPPLPLVRAPASPLAVSLVNVRGHAAVHGHLLLHCAAFLVADFAVVIGGGGSDSVRRFARVACRRRGREGRYSDAGVSIKRRGMPRRPLRVRACMPGRHACFALYSIPVVDAAHCNLFTLFSLLLQPTPWDLPGNALLRDIFVFAPSDYFGNVRALRADD